MPLQNMELGELVYTHHSYLEYHWLYSNWFNWKFEQKLYLFGKKIHM